MRQITQLPLSRSGKPFLVLLVAASLLFAAGTALIRPEQKAVAATNNTINFQARLMTGAGAIVPDGFYNVEFKIYDADTSGVLLFTDTYFDSNGGTAGNDARIRVANGYLTIPLGGQAGNSFPPTMEWD